MAEETATNGVESATGEDQTAENFYDLDQDSKATDLSRTLGALDQANKELKERIKKLTIELQGSDEDKKAVDSIAARAMELETEVARLQHDLITAMNEGEEANAEVAELKKMLGERGAKMESLEKEVDALKKDKAESEKKVRELERRVGLLEVREIEERSKKVRVEEEMREKIDEKERELSGFKKKVDDLETELDKWKFEKKSVEEALKESEKKSTEMEFKILHLQKEIEEAERVIGELRSKMVDGKLGTDAANKSFNWQWPVVAVAAAAVCTLYARRR